MLTLALGKVGDGLWTRVGREPSGTAFNSIVQLEFEKGRPRNPFINAGAIAVADLILAGHQPRRRSARSCSSCASWPATTASPSTTRWRGRRPRPASAISRWRSSCAPSAGCEHPAELVLGVYFHHCALAMTCRQLANAGLFLAAGGRNPLTGGAVVSRDRARRINALMLMCGHYDGSGDFAYRVGLPGKSGVGGGILAVAPGKASIAVWSPGLGPTGNSLLGTAALEMLTQRTGWSVFGP